MHLIFSQDAHKNCLFWLSYREASYSKTIENGKLKTLMISLILGCVSILLGFLILLLPLLLTELSRPRDGLLGSLFLAQGLVLYLDSDLFKGSPLIVLVVGVIIFSKMLLEIAESRWERLAVEEKNRIRSLERWYTSFSQLASVLKEMVKSIFQLHKILAIQPKKKVITKKWVRPEINEATQQQGFDREEKKRLES